MARVIRAPSPSTEAGAERGSGRSMPSKIVSGQVFDAKTTATAILAEARDRASAMIAAAHAEAEQLHQQARSAGADEGRAEALALYTAAEACFATALADAEETAMTLAMEIARRIVRNEIETSPERIGSIARDVLSRARRATSVVIRANPLDILVLRELQQRGEIPPTVALEADAGIDRGGIVARTDLGIMDAQVGTQLDSFLSALHAQQGRSTAR